jgi:hypothetical protein
VSTTLGKLLNPTDVGYDIVVPIGQSNNEGRATDYDLTRIDLSDPRIFQFGNTGTYANVISLAVEPLATITASGMGPNLRWARSYLHTVPGNRRVLLVPAAKGGTCFEGASAPAGWTWKIGRTDVANLYTMMLTQLAAAWAAAEAQFPGKNRVVAALWVQGETDGDNGTTGPTYQTDLDALITQFRADVAGYVTPGSVVPFVIGGMVPEYLSTGTRQAIHAVHVDTPRRQARTGFAYGIAGANKGDGNHYNAAGQRGLADGLWNAFLRAKTNVTDMSPVTPTGLALTQSGTSVLATWAQPAGRATDFNVRYSTDGGTTWSTLTRTQSIDVAATIPGQTLPSTVTVQVRTVNEQGTSAWSASKSITLVTAPGQVTGLATGSVSAFSVPLTWNVLPAATSFLIEKSTNSGSTWTSAGTAPAGATSATVTTTANTSYQFRVTGINPAGSGPASATVSATTPTPPLLLDTLGVTADRAYSLRQMKSANTTAITVRRTSDNTTQDIGFSGGLLDTASLSTFVGSGSGYVTKWWDQSGNGRHLTQATTSAQPMIVNAGTVVTSGGKPAVTFDGSDDVLYTSTASLWAAGAATACSVLKASTPAAPGRWWAESVSTLAGAQYSLMQPNNAGVSTGQGVISTSDSNAASIITAQGSLAPFNGAIHQSSATDTGTALAQWLDGAVDLTSTAYTRPSSTTKDRFALGGVIRSGSLAPAAMTFSESLFFASVLSTSNRQTVEADQKTFYGTP